MRFLLVQDENGVERNRCPHHCSVLLMPLTARLVLFSFLLFLPPLTTLALSLLDSVMAPGIGILGQSHNGVAAAQSVPDWQASHILFTTSLFSSS